MSDIDIQRILDRQLSKGNLDIERLTDLMKQMLDRVWGTGWGIFSSESPTGNDPETTVTPHITYNVARRTPAKNKGLKQRPFQSFPDPEDNDHHITIYRRWFECQVDFVIYAKTNHEAMAIAQEFEDFMDAYIGFFKEKGIAEIVFLSEESPKVSSENRQDIPTRTIRYSVTIERPVAVRSIHFQEIETIVGTNPDEPPMGDIITDPDDEHAINDQDGVPVRERTFHPNQFMDLYKENFPRR